MSSTCLHCGTSVSDLLHRASDWEAIAFSRGSWPSSNEAIAKAMVEQPCSSNSESCLTAAVQMADIAGSSLCKRVANAQAKFEIACVSPSCILLLASCANLGCCCCGYDAHERPIAKCQLGEGPNRVYQFLHLPLHGLLLNLGANGLHERYIADIENSKGPSRVRQRLCSEAIYLLDRLP